MRDHWVRDELGRFADIPGVGDDAPSRGHSGSSHVANSATTPGGTRTSVPSHESKAAPGNEFVARNRDRANREQAAKTAEYKASTTPEQRAADLDAFFNQFDSPSSAPVNPPKGASKAEIQEAQLRRNATVEARAKAREAKKQSIAAKQADIEAARGGKDPYRDAVNRRNAGGVSQGDTNVSWTSPRGSVITNVEQVDVYTLNRMYEAESAGQPIPKADAKTERAWKLGYLKPKR
jgi:hypothetical protein